MQGKLARFVDGKRRARVTVPRLSHRAGVAINLAPEALHGLQMGVAGHEHPSQYPLEILGAGLEVLVDGVGPTAVHQPDLADLALHREGTQPIQMFGVDDITLVGQTIVHAARTRAKSTARHVPVVVAHHTWNVSFAQFAAALVDLRVIAHHVACAIDLRHAQPVDLAQHRLERLKVAVDVRDERRFHRIFARRCSARPGRA